MARFDRYMLSQLMVVFGFFALVLILVYWVNRAVILFDQLIADGQSALVFLEFTALSLPSLIRIVLPLAAFFATLYVTNRMANESELTVVQATGYSTFRLARPVLIFGGLVTAMMLVLMHFLVPMSTQQLDLRQAQVAENATARLLREGQFLSPVDGITVYIRDIGSDGELRNIFLTDASDPAETISYTANRAYLLRGEAGPQIVMFEGMIQTLRNDTMRLVTTMFDEVFYDIGPLSLGGQDERRSASAVPTRDLLAPTPELAAETGRTEAELIVQGHDRFGQSLLASVAAMLGFATLLIGGFSRFGLWRQIGAAVFLVILVKGIETMGISAARQSPSLWFLTYLPTLVGAAIIWFLLFWAGRPYLFRPRPRVMPETVEAAT